MRRRGPPDERGPDALLSFGVVNLDKPAGPSAHQVTGWVRDLAGVDRAAHAGTLDPKVTGCLPVLLGDATRLAQVFRGADKEYVAVLELHDDPPADLEAVLGEFEGPIYQTPPRRSAVARRLRVRTVHAIDLLEVRGRKALLRVRCEAGTYVRKLCHDVGLALGTGAHMGDLRRTAAGPFDDRDLASLPDLADALAFHREDGDLGPLREAVAPAERALVDLARVTIAESAAEQVAHGAPVYAPGVLDVEWVDGDGGPDDEATGGDGGTGGGEERAGEGDSPAAHATGEHGHPSRSDDADEAPLVACYTPDGAVVCLGWLVGDPAAESGTVVELERVLV